MSFETIYLVFFAIKSVEIHYYPIIKSGGHFLTFYGFRYLDFLLSFLLLSTFAGGSFGIEVFTNGRLSSRYSLEKIPSY